MNNPIEAALRPIVRQYGLGSVLESLGKIADAQRESPVQAGGSSDADKGKKSKKRSVKATALEYVSKLELSSEKVAPVVDLAERFERKAFLPTFGDIAHFCQIYGIEVPASKTRASAIPRVFKHIASMETEEIQRILDDGLFSGPSRLGPIADAIRRNGRTSTPPDSSPAHDSTLQPTERHP